MENSRTLDDLGPLYHDYSLFGVSNEQLPGIFAVNQRSKEPTINAYIRRAISESRSDPGGRVSFAELFCADGYYAMVARRFGADECYGVDNDREGHFGNAPRIAERLGLSDIRFIQEEIDNIGKLPRVDIVANLGGLYHVPNPREVLEKSFAMARRFLIVQTVVSLRDESPEYFEAPAPGWTWGCRFSRGWLDEQIARFGWNVLEQSFNELEGNDRPDDRGSAYYLISVV